jgi:hypothetical protein
MLLHHNCGIQFFIVSGFCGGSGLGFVGVSTGGNTVDVIVSIVVCCSGIVCNFCRYSSHLALAIS